MHGEHMTRPPSRDLWSQIANACTHYAVRSLAWPGVRTDETPAPAVVPDPHLPAAFCACGHEEHEHSDLGCLRGCTAECKGSKP